MNILLCRNPSARARHQRVPYRSARLDQLGAACHDLLAPLCAVTERMRANTHLIVNTSDCAASDRRSLPTLHLAPLFCDSFASDTVTARLEQASDAAVEALITRTSINVLDRWRGDALRPIDPSLHRALFSELPMTRALEKSDGPTAYIKPVLVHLGQQWKPDVDADADTISRQLPTPDSAADLLVVTNPALSEAAEHLVMRLNRQERTTAHLAIMDDHAASDFYTCLGNSRRVLITGSDRYVDAIHAGVPVFVWGESSTLSAQAEHIDSLNALFHATEGCRRSSTAREQDADSAVVHDRRRQVPLNAQQRWLVERETSGSGVLSFRHGRRELSQLLRAFIEVAADDATSTGFEPAQATLPSYSGAPIFEVPRTKERRSGRRSDWLKRAVLG